MRKLNKGILIAAFAFLGIVTGIFIKGTVDGFNEEMDVAQYIEKAIKKNCDCEAVNQFMYARGIQYSIEDGLTTEKAEFELVNCQYKNLEDEVRRLNKTLQNEVARYTDLDLLTLEFVGTDQHHTITIKNGIIQ